MSREVKVEEWIRKMGYGCEMPKNFSTICSPSVVHIWEQLITNIIPRQKAEYIKRQVIIQRLSTQDLHHQDQYSYPIKEIQLYAEKKTLEKRIKTMEENSEEKEKNIDDYLERNGFAYMTIENLKMKIKESRQKKFLLERKLEIIKREHEEAEETLILAKNLTPVETDASTSNSEEILKTLQQCAEKLQKLSTEASFPRTEQNSLRISFMKTPQKEFSYMTNTFSRYLSNSATRQNINSTLITTLQFPKVKHEERRESLGLLPDDCLALSFSESQDSTLKSCDVVEKLQSEKNVKNILKNLIHKNNRLLILTQCQNIYEQLITEVRTVMKECKINSLSNEANLNPLYFIHIKSALESKKCRILLENLQEITKRKKEEMLEMLRAKSQIIEEAKRMFELQIEYVCLSAANEFLRKEMEKIEVFHNNDYDMMTSKIHQMKEEITFGTEHINFLMEKIHQVLKNIRTNRDDASVGVKQLAPYFHDLKWAEVLNHQVNSQELELFKDFPLEFNRKFQNSPDFYYRDISDTTIQSYHKINEKDFKKITILLNEPFSFPENVLFDTLQTKVCYKKLKSVSSSTDYPLEYRTYTLEELFKKEGEDLEPAITKLDSVINSDLVKEVLTAPSTITEEGNCWLELLNNNYISEERKVEGHNYKFYENILKEEMNN